MHVSKLCLKKLLRKRQLIQTNPKFSCNNCSYRQRSCIIYPVLALKGKPYHILLKNYF